jgi:hypothetical protein
MKKDTVFLQRVTNDVRLAFKATTVAYHSKSLKDLGYEDVTVAHTVSYTGSLDTRKRIAK